MSNSEFQLVNFHDYYIFYKVKFINKIPYDLPCTYSFQSDHIPLQNNFHL